MADKAIKNSARYVEASSLKLLENNPRKINKKQLDTLCESIKNNPDYFEARPIIASDRTGELVVIAGNQRLRASRRLGIKRVPTVIMHGLSEEKEREIIIRDNVSNGEWDVEALAKEWEFPELEDWGVTFDGWTGMNQTDEDVSEYTQFVDKFKPKLTTDDCFTPPRVYEAVEKWVRKTYPQIKGLETIRPFKPEGDYRAEDYKDKVVIDNPPFSIGAEIVRFYLERHVPFFLFCDGRTPGKIQEGVTLVIAAASVIYENGANVVTSFKTNLEPENAVRVANELHTEIRAAQPSESDLRQVAYPKNLTSPARLNIRLMTEAGTSDIIIPRDEAMSVSTLDDGTALYGGGILLSTRKFEEIDNALEAGRCARDKKAKDASGRPKGRQLSLSPRELEIVKELDEKARRKKWER